MPLEKQKQSLTMAHTHAYKVVSTPTFLPVPKLRHRLLSPFCLFEKGTFHQNWELRGPTISSPFFFCKGTSGAFETRVRAFAESRTVRVSKRGKIKEKGKEQSGENGTKIGVLLTFDGGKRQKQKRERGTRGDRTRDSRYYSILF